MTKMTTNLGDIGSTQRKGENPISRKQSKKKRAIQ
jgi:hypothetical protein